MTKKRILFVDDELHVLEGFRRMLRSMRDQWSIDTANSGEEALEKLSAEPFDMIITDMRMPGMDGAQLLKEVMKTYPHVVRIILSAQVDQESALRAVGSTHQYISKPCDASTLKTTVDRAWAIHHVIKNQKLQQLVSQLQTLPSFPPLYTEIMKEIRSPEPNIEKIGTIISRDVGMTAKILQVVNSSFFGFYTNVRSPQHAVTLLGTDNIRSLIITIHIFSQFSQYYSKRFNLNNLWHHSFIVAKCAKALAQAENQPKALLDECYMAGLMHDVGKLIIIANLPEAFDQISEEIANKESVTLQEIENKFIGAGHAEIGGYLLGLWGLPASTVEAVIFHHNPSHCPNENQSPLTFVHIANALVLKLFPQKGFFTQPLDNDYLIKLGLQKKIDSWLTICTDIFSEEEAHE